MWMRGCEKRTALVCVLALFAAAGCGLGADTDSGSSATKTKSTTAATTPGTSAAKKTADDMVAAVPQGKSPGPISVRFNITERPEVGEPVPIEVELVPSLKFERVLVNFSATDGLKLTGGASLPMVERPEPDVPISHTVTVVPQRDGIFTVVATVLSDSQSESVTRVFSIPVIAGQGIAPLAAATPANANNASP